MYICSNCGTAFDGRVCPSCCTMRPAAAVLGNSGRILRNREASAVPPQEQAEHFAEELEFSRQADAWRRQQQEHAEEMRRRAAELAQAASRQQEQPPSPEEQRYARQAEKAANWKRKAPGLRTHQPEEVDVEMPDALRSLKIDSKNPLRPAAGHKEAPRKNTAATESSQETARSVSYPVSPKTSSGKRTAAGRAPASSPKIDAAWRSFASGEAPSGKNVSPRLPEEADGREAALPRPPAPPVSSDK